MSLWETDAVHRGRKNDETHPCLIDTNVARETCVRMYYCSRDSWPLGIFRRTIALLIFQRSAHVSWHERKRKSFIHTTLVNYSTVRTDSDREVGPPGGPKFWLRFILL